MGSLGIASRSDWTQSRQRLATAAMFLRSCVVQALSRGDGAAYREYIEGFNFCFVYFRWKIFRQCVEYKVGHCSNTWDIVTLWNYDQKQPYFNKTEISCGNTAPSQVKSSQLVHILCVLVTWMMIANQIV